jgi:hypothetical protein
MSPRTLLLLLLLMAPAAAAELLPGIQLYESGEYEASARSFEEVLADPQRPAEDRRLARIYLAASLHALGQVDEARQQLEVIAREHPGRQVDAIRFPPELVALAEAIRERVETERWQAEQEALRKRQEQEAARARKPSQPESSLRPELLGLFEARDRALLLGGGLAYSHGALEGSARVWISPSPVFHLQGGLLLGNGVLRPHLGLRATLVPGEGGYGAGALAGGRISLPAGLVGLVDVGGDYFFVSDEAHQRFALTVQVGLGLELFRP